MIRRLAVHLPAQDAHYEVLVQPGALAGLGEHMRNVAPHEKAMLALDSNIAATHGETARQSLASAGYSVAVHTLIADEQHKTIETVSVMYDDMLAAGMERGSPVIALGGGVVGDVAGFAAATYMRGVPLVQVPTTLLAMVDSAIGGKTGVNWPVRAATVGERNADAASNPHGRGSEMVVKNLIGSFHQPRMVIADPNVLTTLDDRELQCGLAECIKHGLIADRSLLDFITDNLAKIIARDAATLTQLIAQSAAVKIAIVQADEREAGMRALLNLGHTFAHVIEPLHELNLKHGEAVAIGLCAAAHTAVLTGRLDQSRANEIESLIAQAGLPTRLLQRTGSEKLIAAMSHDKKVEAGRLRLILPAGDTADIVSDVPHETIAAAWKHVGA